MAIPPYQYFKNNQNNYPNLVLQSNPTSYWRLQEPSGTVAVDLGSNKINGSYLTGNTPELSKPLITTDHSLSYSKLSSNSSGLVSVPANANLFPTGNFSAELWLQIPANYTGGMFLTQIFNSGGNNLTFAIGGMANGSFPQGIYDGIYPFVGTYNTNTAWTGVQSPNPFIVSAIYHIVATYDGTNLSLYINGSLTSQAAVTINYYNSTGLYIGRRWDSQNGTIVYFNGYMQDVAIYNTALSASVILSHYTKGTN